jgi:hypothetical protein
VITLTVRPETARGVLEAAEQTGYGQDVSSWPLGPGWAELTIEQDALSALLSYLVGVIGAHRELLVR